MSAGSKGLFRTPRGCCLPFGTLELAVAAAGRGAEFAAALAALEISSSDASASSPASSSRAGGAAATSTAATLEGDALEEACAKLRTLVAALELPEALLAEVCSVFTNTGGNNEDGGNGPVLLAVRSSANVEDLAGMSAAGLYESVVGVAAEDRAAVGRATAAVWASLYTRRAVLSRRWVLFER